MLNLYNKIAPQLHFEALGILADFSYKEIIARIYAIKKEIPRLRVLRVEALDMGLVSIINYKREGLN